MPDALPPAVKKTVLEARELLSAAERELESALREVNHGERADKRMVSERVTAAFTALTKARERLDSALAA